MLDPTVLDAITTAAAEAVAGIAVEASTPAWRRLLARSKPDPKCLRQNHLWHEVKLSVKESEAIKDYLNGPLCKGIVQILTYIMQVDEGPAYEHEERELRESFCKELLIALGGETKSHRSVAVELWAMVKASVQLQIAPMIDTDIYVESKLLVQRLTSRRTKIAADSPDAESISIEASERTQNTTNEARKLSVASIVLERGQLADSIQRSSNAVLLAQQVREAFRAAYSNIVMPHSRDDYRVPVENIYVKRNVIPLKEKELRDLRLGIFTAADEDESDLCAEDDIGDHRYVLIGNPGAGKSTFVRHLMYGICSDPSMIAREAPLVIELKSYDAVSSKPFHETIADRLRYMDHIETTADVVADMLTLGLGFVVFDGLDEITNLSRRRDAVQAIESFCRRFPLVKIIVTSRVEGYSGARLNPWMFSALRLPDFTEDQVGEYVHRWFDHALGISSAESQPAADSFLRESALHAADLRTNPLMLSLLCMVYKYNGYIPENRPRIYEECTELLFERWDNIRHIRPEIEPDSKGRYLVQELAYYFFTRQSTQGGGIEEHMLLLVLQDYLRRNVVSDLDIARNRARDFLDYCAGRAWVITMIGTSPKGNRIFAFTHRTFMEYFVACYLARQHTNAIELVNSLRKYIREGSSEVIPQIAIQRYDEIAADGLDNCLSVLLFDSPNITSRVQCKYLPFVIRCLNLVRPAPRTMEKIFQAAVVCYLTSRSKALLASIDASNEDYATSLERFGRETLGRELEADNIAFGVKVGCYELLIAQKSPRFETLLRDFEGYFREHLVRFKRTYPDVLVDVLLRVGISMTEFRTVCSAEQLIWLTRFTSTKTVQEPGALLRELENLTAALPQEDGDSASADAATRLSGRFGPGSKLQVVTSYLFESPDTVLPMSVSAMNALLSAFEKFSEEGAWVARALTWDSVDFHALTFVILLGSIELDIEPPDVIVAWVGGKGWDSYLGRLRSFRYRGAGQVSASTFRRFGLTKPWVEFARMWALRQRSVVREEDDEFYEEDDEF